MKICDCCKDNLGTALNALTVLGEEYQKATGFTEVCDQCLDVANKVHAETCKEMHAKSTQAAIKALLERKKELHFSS